MATISITSDRVTPKASGARIVTINARELNL